MRFSAYVSRLSGISCLLVTVACRQRCV